MRTWLKSVCTWMVYLRSEPEVARWRGTHCLDFVRMDPNGADNFCDRGKFPEVSRATLLR